MRSCCGLSLDDHALDFAGGRAAGREERLWFQLTKTALPVWILYRHLVKILETDIQRRGVADSVKGKFHVFTNLFDLQSAENRGAEMQSVMHGLMYRFVTDPSDEPLIIATLLALDLRPILAAEPAERINVLWRIMGTSPFGINKYILFHMGPKLNERGLRWAPQSLLCVEGHFNIPIPGEEENRGFLLTVQNTNSLIVEPAGFRISTAKPAQSCQCT